MRGREIPHESHEVAAEHVGEIVDTKIDATKANKERQQEAQYPNKKYSRIATHAPHCKMREHPVDGNSERRVQTGKGGKMFYHQCTQYIRSRATNTKLEQCHSDKRADKGPHERYRHLITSSQ